MAEEEAPLELNLPSKRRKKKKGKSKGAEAAAEDAVEDVAVDGEEGEGEGDGEDGGGDAALELALPSKRKRKDKKKKRKDKDAAEDDGEGGDDELEAGLADGQDWTYDQLLTRAFQQIRMDNPDADNPGSTTVHLEAPALIRVGTKKTGIVNFKELCDSMNRPLQHVLAFVLAELGTTGTFAADHRLTLKGRFQNKHIENVLRHYVSNYVICHNCKKSNTDLEKENRLYFVQCNLCRARRSVASIDKGYVAQVGRRRNRK